LLGHLVRFARENRAYWIVPLVLAIGLVATLVVTAEAAGPLVYTLW
jgi:hypothetical protein